MPISLSQMQMQTSCNGTCNFEAQGCHLFHWIDGRGVMRGAGLKALLRGVVENARRSHILLWDTAATYRRRMRAMSEIDVRDRVASEFRPKINSSPTSEVIYNSAGQGPSQVLMSCDFHVCSHLERIAIKKCLALQRFLSRLNLSLFMLFCLFETEIMCSIYDQDDHICHTQPLKVPGTSHSETSIHISRIHTSSIYILLGPTAYVQTFKLPLFRQLVPRNPNPISWFFSDYAHHTNWHTALVFFRQSRSHPMTDAYTPTFPTTVLNSTTKTSQTFPNYHRRLFRVPQIRRLGMVILAANLWGIGLASHLGMQRQA
jgi:hypothetical protein